MATDGETGKPRVDETNLYLQNHRILELFNNMTSQLIFNRPADPKKFMIENLERLQKAKSTKRDCPCLFDDSNIQSVYGMLDPTNRGYITLQQYCEALETLGIKGYDAQPDGAMDNRVTFDTFLHAARDGLQKASATFMAS
ncbi:EF-hand calcium-binding domain-containing protein 10-like [Ruditapes philippinarum]|uniref:EF-hand calcium-binding domain-containing protein 10-like n=1 Tax=Ruditapes philippinarum TaxID=129788 RepID=UPI00295B8265|nr:EF-hand calcium-binding domain-containing protein 10-like [Ruditapes philippinarum]